MKKEKKAKHFINKPSYPGGFQAMKKFIAENKKYPKEALDNNIEGTVRIKYDIDYKGKVVAAHVQSGIGYGCNEEAQRVVKMLKFEVPKTRKVKVLFHKTINIHFKKPKSRQIKTTVSYSYTLTPKKKEVVVKKKSTSHSYTIIKN
jgi:protein TonB